MARNDRVLSKLLEFGYEGSNGRRKMLSKPSFRKTIGEDRVKRIKNKELLKTENLESDTLIQEEILNKIYEGTEPFVCMRDALPTVNTDSNSLRIVLGESGSYAVDVGEGTEVDVYTQDYTTTDISINKIGTGALVSNELVEDGLWDVVEMEIQKAGKRMENKLNRDCISELLSGITNETDMTGSDMDMSTLASIKGKIKAYEYMPGTFIYHPTMEAEMIQDSNILYANRAGTAEYLKTGEMPPVLGLDPDMTSITLADSDANNWGDSANDNYGLVYDKDNIALLAMRRDISLKNYDDPIHDVTGAFATMRFGVSTIRANAGHKIKY